MFEKYWDMRPGSVRMPAVDSVPGSWALSPHARGVRQADVGVGEAGVVPLLSARGKNGEDGEDDVHAGGGGRGEPDGGELHHRSRHRCGERELRARERGECLREVDRVGAHRHGERLRRDDLRGLDRLRFGGEPGGDLRAEGVYEIRPLVPALGEQMRSIRAPLAPAHIARHALTFRSLRPACTLECTVWIVGVPRGSGEIQREGFSLSWL